ncbi:MAG: nucleolar protein 10 [Amphiamblys sp. WSBS2006]|nr:MAG: nucleolar protein 10 [Amphiamblys sp. WSBS2006]
MRAINITGYRHTNIEQEIVRKEQKKSKEWRGRIELIQGFSFPTTATHIAFTPDKTAMVGCGVYRPQFKVFLLGELSVLFERSLNSGAKAIEFLSKDWKRLCFMQENRRLEFHSDTEMVESVRMPWLGRKMFYERGGCEVVCCGASSEGAAFSAEAGKFTRYFPTTSKSLDACCHSGPSRLYLFGGVSGRVSLFDGRQKEKVLCLRERDCSDGAVTSLLVQRDGVTVCVGSSEGRIGVHDIRNGGCLFTKDHFYGESIRKMEQEGDVVLSSDCRVVRVWDRRSGATRGSIETETEINDFTHDGGYVAVACEEEQMQSFYLPELGAAPKWAEAVEKYAESIEENRKNCDRFFTDRDFGAQKDPAGVPCMHGYIVPSGNETGCRDGEGRPQAEGKPKKRREKKAASVWG